MDQLSAAVPQGGGLPFDPSSLLMPLMMSNLQDPGLADSGPDTDLEHDRERYHDDGPQRGGPSAAPQPAQPTVTTPPVQQSPGETTAAPDPGQQDAANAPRTVRPTGETARDEDGRIPYTHTGDNVTEQVWPSVADAYEAAYSNKGGTDGKAAYAGTDAEWLDEKALEPVDPSDLASGDLITFDDGSAVVRVQPEEGDPEGGIVDVIIKGELTPVAEVMADGAGELGRFAGFRRPPGIEPPAPAEKSAGLADPGSPSDESGDATMPV
ncbi:hypothetical protein [Nocardia sp. NPDC002869]|uniref:hypothetical protein n=1 Tax=Nocardia sp. NPDC002869 TaxID=3161032 RepID=UPI00398D3F51